jgi:choline dehydrogenase-like flavoprotein
VRLDETDPRRSACIRCGTCDAFPCLVQAKSDADVLCVQPALAHPNVSLLTRATVLRLETSASGREVTQIVVERDGVLERYAGDVVVVSGGAINSAVLLLRSASERHPHGLANGSGVVGRHYMCHLNTMFVALSREPNPTRFHKTFALTDYYFGDEAFPFPMGSVQMIGKLHPEILAEGAPPGTPKRILSLMASHGIPFWLTSEDLPDRENRVLLGSDGRVELHYEPNNEAGHGELRRRIRALLAEANCDMEHWLPTNVYVGGRIPLAGVAHQCGTVRFGRDPQRSALDEHCRAHEVDNLYVVDGSFFPSSAAVNPALTIAANALRVGTHLAERLR